MEYDITNDDRTSTYNAPPPRQWTNKGGKGKGKSYKGKGNKSYLRARQHEYYDAYSVVPSFGSSDGAIQLYIYPDLLEISNPFAVHQPRQVERNTDLSRTVLAPSDAFVRVRLPRSQSYDQTVHRTYFEAMKGLGETQKSFDFYYVQEEGAARYYADLYGQNCPLTPSGGKHDLLQEKQKEILGDFWRVLRTRPSSKWDGQSDDVEYIPNSTYTYDRVKRTLMQVKNFTVKPTRYWNELPLKDVPNDILYSLSEYCPGMPLEARIVRDNEALDLAVYRPVEARYGPKDVATGRRTVNVQGTIHALIGSGALPDTEQASYEEYLTKVQEMLNKYERLSQSWPFLVADRLIKIQLGRLRHIKSALVEVINNHPLSSANCATFGSNVPRGIPSALSDIVPQNGEAEDDQSQRENRSGYYTDRSGKGQ